MKFKEYVEKRNDSTEDIKKTLSKLPREHSDLIKDYKINFQISNSLKNDDKHIGLIDEKNKTITIAAPWNYGREYTFLHEIGHAVWKYLLSQEKKNEWNGLLKNKKAKDLKGDKEEIFCMSYAQYYAKNKLVKFEDESLQNFISKMSITHPLKRVGL